MKKELGRLLRKARLEAGLSQFQLALKTSIHPKNIVDYEMGKVTPRVERLRVMAKALGKPISFFFPEKGKKKKEEKENC